MYFSFSMHDEDSGRHAEISQSNVDHLDDVLEAFLSFLHGCGYSYVSKVGAIKDNKGEHWTL